MMRTAVMRARGVMRSVQALAVLAAARERRMDAPDVSGVQSLREVKVRKMRSWGAAKMAFV